MRMRGQVLGAKSKAEHLCAALYYSFVNEKQEEKKSQELEFIFYIYKKHIY